MPRRHTLVPYQASTRRRICDTALFATVTGKERGGIVLQAFNLLLCATFQYRLQAAGGDPQATRRIFPV